MSYPSSLTSIIHAYSYISHCRSDSTIVTPYEKWIPFKNASLYYSRPPERNYALNKTRKVAWFASHCKTANRREAYAEELGKHIEVHIYGRFVRPTRYKISSQSYRAFISYWFFSLFLSSDSGSNLKKNSKTKKKQYEVNVLYYTILFTLLLISFNNHGKSSGVNL